MACTNNDIIIATNQADGAINQSANRRSADYKANIWNYDQLQFLGGEFQEQEYRTEACKMKEEVQRLFVETIDPVEMLELLDKIGKLGLTTYFKRETGEVLDSFSESIKSRSSYLSIEDDLYASSLCFRILRLNGYNVSQDMFKGLMVKAKKSMNMNVKAMVSLYEASHLAMEGENILEEARVFATTFLKDVRSSSKEKIADEIDLVLELPLNLGVEWFNVRNHINDYEKEDGVIFNLLKLAKLNFNLVQAAHQTDLKDILRWWKLLPTEHLSFTRNRVVESYLWATGVVCEQQYGKLRKWLTKVTKLVIIIDDVYDVFGTLDELEIFTSAVERWDFETTELLPDSMKFCMKMLYDTVAEIAHELLEEKGWMVKQHIQNAWILFCKGLLAEARWYHKRYTPSLHEYLDNGWVTSCGPLLSLHVVYSISPGTQEEATDFLKNNHHLVYNTSMIIRLCNDQGTSKAELERGDAPSSIVCYMKEAGVSEEVARKKITDIITDTWKRINNVCMSQSPSIKCITNMARVAHFIYLKGDGFGVQHHETREQVLALLVDPLPLPLH